MVFTKLKKQGQSGPGILIMLAIIVIGILGVILLAKVGVFTKLSYVEDCESQGGKVVPRGICPDDYISKPDPKDSTRECCYIGNDCLYTDGREKNEGKCDCNKNNKLDDPEDCGKDGGYCFDGKCFQYKKCLEGKTETRKNNEKCDCNWNGKLDDPEDCDDNGGYCYTQDEEEGKKCHQKLL